MMELPNNKLFYLKGAFDGDGHYTKNRTAIVISVTDFDFLEEIKRVIKEIFNRDVKIRNNTPAHDNYKEQRRIYFGCGKEIYLLLKNKVPITNEEKEQYLKGLYDAEGSVGVYNRKHFKKWLTLAQKDIIRLNLWSVYLSELGIQTRKEYTSSGRNQLYITSLDSLHNFNKLIGFRIKRKSDKLKEVLLLSEQVNNKKEEQKIREERIIKIYTSTNFGVRYIARLVNQSVANILRILHKRNIQIIGKDNLKINQKDILNAESILGYPINLKIDSRKNYDFEERFDKITKIYNQTNFGIKYIARMFKVNAPNLQRQFKRKGIKLLNKKNYNSITNEDILLARQISNSSIYIIPSRIKKQEREVMEICQ